MIYFFYYNFAELDEFQQTKIGIKFPTYTPLLLRLLGYNESCFHKNFRDFINGVTMNNIKSGRFSGG